MLQIFNSSSFRGRGWVTVSRSLSSQFSFPGYSWGQDHKPKAEEAKKLKKGVEGKSYWGESEGRVKLFPL